MLHEVSAGYHFAPLEGADTASECDVPHIGGLIRGKLRR
jgi:hypothetical protein